MNKIEEDSNNIIVLESIYYCYNIFLSTNIQHDKSVKKQA